MRCVDLDHVGIQLLVKRASCAPHSRAVFDALVVEVRQGRQQVDVVKTGHRFFGRAVKKTGLAEVGGAVKKTGFVEVGGAVKKTGFVEVGGAVKKTGFAEDILHTSAVGVASVHDRGEASLYTGLQDWLGLGIK
jgi:hypothetical protein